MSPDDSSLHDAELIARVKAGDPQAWRRLIEQFEGRLVAYVNSRIQDRSSSEDIVQDAFIGFLNSLPNYDEQRSLESYLFSICAYKLTDHLRREGRRPSLQLRHLSGNETPENSWIGTGRVASSIARSAEQKKIEEQVIRQAICEQVDHWKTTKQWTKLKAIELTYVAGLGNQEVASLLAITEQQVANFKSDFQARLKSIIKRKDLDSIAFPELEDPP
ncbi:MAG: RNA polymerase sigma factor [Rubripirellula sp.]|nr:RNA polymerase sigma factor [Rubripirellula sp.]